MASQSEGVITPVVFSFNSLSICAKSDEHGNARFVASDVCKILGGISCRKLINDHRRENDVSKRYTIDRIGCGQETILINEGNLYRLIIESNKPEEEKFERLAMEEILPVIHKTGSYSKSKNQIAENSTKTSKCYNYTRHLLEQPHFKAPTRSDRFSRLKLGHQKEFSSRLLHELKMCDQNIEVPYDEYIAAHKASKHGRKPISLC